MSRTLIDLRMTVSCAGCQYPIENIPKLPSEIVPLSVRDMWEVRNEANARCGDSEQAHGIVKSDFAGGMLPSGRFGANGCWVFLACLSHNPVLSGRELMVAGTRWMRVRMKAFRAAFIYRSGRLVCHANRLVLKLSVTGNGRLEEGWNKLFKLRV